jgi:hypothetical protein
MYSDDALREVVDINHKITTVNHPGMQCSLLGRAGTNTGEPSGWLKQHIVQALSVFLFKEILCTAQFFIS